MEDYFALNEVAPQADQESTGIAKAAQALKFFDKAAHRKFLKSRATKVPGEGRDRRAVGAPGNTYSRLVSKSVDY